MKLVGTLSFLGAVAALPQGTTSPPRESLTDLVGKLTTFYGATDSVNSISNDLVTGSQCKDIIYIVARGSLEPGNMGFSMGPLLCKSLKQAYPDRVACQGVGAGEGYGATIQDNMIKPKGTSEAAIAAAGKMFQLAHQKCPASLLVFTGYSQGAAVMHSVVGALPDDVKKATVGGVLFGSTKNKQDEAQIRNYPKDQVVSYCTEDDGVCWGNLIVTGGHFAYLTNGDGPKAVTFLKSKIDQALKGKAA